jgi:hypothetical protein
VADGQGAGPGNPCPDNEPIAQRPCEGCLEIVRLVGSQGRDGAGAKVEIARFKSDHHNAKLMVDYHRLGGIILIFIDFLSAHPHVLHEFSGVNTGSYLAHKLRNAALCWRICREVKTVSLLE